VNGGRRTGRVTAALLVLSLIADGGQALTPQPAQAVPTAGGLIPVAKQRDVPPFHDYPGVRAAAGVDDELAVVLSALGSTRQVQSTRTAAIDLVIVLDNSYSMNQCVGSSANCNTAGTYRNSRAYAMVQGVNNAIAALVAADPNLRIAMVQFGTDSSVLFPPGPRSSSAAPASTWRSRRRPAAARR
jgi:hypothetical protein